jgi:hypothetical protein
MTRLTRLALRDPGQAMWAIIIVAILVEMVGAGLVMLAIRLHP